jgi:transposase-like protein
VTESNNPKRYSPEFKDEAARMVVDLSRPIAQVAEELGINRTTLGFWVKTYRQFHSGDELSMDMPDQAWNRPDQPADITGQPAYITDQPYIAGQPADRGDNVERAELTRRVSAALAGLDHDEREVIELHLRHDLDIADLAAVLGMPRNKVDALASRACGKLERALGALLIARMGRDACPALDSLLADWDGRLTTLTAPTRYLVTQHIERCEACEKGSRRALRAAVLSGIGPPAALPSGLREQVLNLDASRNPDAAAGRPDVVQRAASRPPDELAGATRFPWWSRIRANPGAATATGAIALWGMAALSAVLILVTGGRAVGDLAVHIGNGPVAIASAPASPSSGASASAKARSRPAPSSPPAHSNPPSAGVPAPAAALAGTPTAPGSPAVPGSQASPSDSPEPSAFPSPSASSSPSQLPAPLRSSTATSSPSPSLSPSSSPSPSLSPSPSPSSTRTRRPRPRPSHSRSPSPRPSSSTATPGPATSPPPFPLSL